MPPRAGALVLKPWTDFLNTVAKELPGLAADAAQAAMEHATEWLLQNVPSYPGPPAPGDWPGFQTDKQRRWFFWALQSGELERIKATTPPLIPSLKAEVTVLRGGQGVVGIIYSDLPWTPWVLGPDYPGTIYPGLNSGKPIYQARIHQNRWWQLGEWMEEQSEDLWEKFNEYLFEGLSGAFDILTAWG